MAGRERVTRSSLRPRRRGARIFLLAAIAALFIAGCTLYPRPAQHINCDNQRQDQPDPRCPPPQPPPPETPEPHASRIVGTPATWILNGENATIATIQQNAVGFIAVTVNPDYRYQWAVMRGAGLRAGSTVTQEIHELWSRNLGADAATRVGWRNPMRLNRYFVPVTEFTGRRAPDGIAYIDVRSDGDHEYLIVITRIAVPSE